MSDRERSYPEYNVLMASCPVENCRGGTVNAPCSLRMSEARRWSGCSNGTLYDSDGKPVGRCPHCQGKGHLVYPCTLCDEGFVTDAVRAQYLAEQAERTQTAERERQKNLEATTRKRNQTHDEPLRLGAKQQTEVYERRTSRIGLGPLVVLSGLVAVGYLVKAEWSSSSRPGAPGAQVVNLTDGVRVGPIYGKAIPLTLGQDQEGRTMVVEASSEPPGVQLELWQGTIQNSDRGGWFSHKLEQTSAGIGKPWAQRERASLSWKVRPGTYTLLILSRGASVPTKQAAEYSIRYE